MIIFSDLKKSRFSWNILNGVWNLAVSKVIKRAREEGIGCTIIFESWAIIGKIRTCLIASSIWPLSIWNDRHLRCMNLCFLLHLGLVSRIVWNASHDCPLSEHSIPLRLIGGQWPPLWTIATRPMHLTSLLVRYLSFFHTIRTIYQISRTF